MMNLLDQLKQVTTIVADTGDFERMRQYTPQDATTNPTLILKASKLTNYAHLIEKTKIAYREQSLDEVMDQLLVAFGIEILQIVPGRVSTEIDARLSFDTAASVARAQKIIAIYAEHHIPKSRILIKIAATWEGIQAAKILEQEGIHCNLTLVFNLMQAVACAQAKVQLISPFIGRITDWYKRDSGNAWDELAMSGVNDPGVKSVRHIYNYFKNFQIDTEIMGASFRNINQIKSLAGCDLLTISPELLEELKNTSDNLHVELSPAKAVKETIQAITCDAESFNLAMQSDPMAREKLAEGINQFSKDIDQLLELLKTT